jgi:hypothetical protein
MRQLIAIVVCLLSFGCAPPQGSPSQHAAAEPTTRAIVPARTVFVGQPWPEAEAIVQASGCVLGDAGNLEYGPQLHGFAVDLPSGQGLLVCHEAGEEHVDLVVLIDGWSGWKVDRVPHDVQRYTFTPPATRAAR